MLKKFLLWILIQLEKVVFCYSYFVAEKFKLLLTINTDKSEILICRQKVVWQKGVRQKITRKVDIVFKVINNNKGDSNTGCVTNCVQA